MFSFTFYSKMLRSLQTSKNSTSTLSCLLVPAVAMIKGIDPRLFLTHTHAQTHLTQVFHFAPWRLFLFFCCFFFFCLAHTAALLWLSLHFWHCCLIACQKTIHWLLHRYTLGFWKVKLQFSSLFVLFCFVIFFGGLWFFLPRVKVSLFHFSCMIDYHYEAKHWSM